MEKIVKIEQTTFKLAKEDWNTYEGFQITTTKQIIKLGIENGQSCCENWGYFMSDDNFNDFEGATISDVYITDTQLKVVNDFDAKNLYEGGVMFVNINTDKGLLQFVAYNEHNGYYGHEATVISEQVTQTNVL